MAGIQQDITLGDRYRLVERIASGGMGTVWRAEDLVLHRTVAVKVLSESLGSDAKFLERFRREARAAAGLSHPNVAGVFDYGEDGDTPFMVMELIEGETLAGRLRREGRLPPAEAARIATQVASALQAAHDAGVVHRDVKPANVMLTARGECKVMDFGIAAAAWAAPLTATGATIGTASYLSPEQAAGERATPASDVYSLGCVLYETLTGRPPFTGDNPVAVAAAHLTQTPAPVRQLAPEVPESMAAATDQALAKDPAGRPASAQAFAAMLAAPGPATQPTPSAATGPVPPATTRVLPAAEPTARLTTSPAPAAAEATPPVSPALAPKPRSHRRTWLAALVLVAAAIVAIVLIVALGGGSGSPAGQSSPPKPKKVEVPALTGLPLSQALGKLAAAGLEVHDVKRVDGPEDVVMGSEPAGGSHLTRGDSVTLFVGNGHGPGGDKGKGKGHDKNEGD